MTWYAIRSVYHFGMKPDGKNIYEERVVCFKASSLEEAHEKAEKESEGYSRLNNIKAHPESLAYELDEEKLIDGYGVWSELYESQESREEFYEHRYAKYRYRPQ